MWEVDPTSLLVKNKIVLVLGCIPFNYDFPTVTLGLAPPTLSCMVTVISDFWLFDPLVVGFFIRGV